MLISWEIPVSTVMRKLSSDLDGDGFGIRYEKYLTPGCFSSEVKACLIQKGLVVILYFLNNI